MMVVRCTLLNSTGYTADSTDSTSSSSLGFYPILLFALFAAIIWFGCRYIFCLSKLPELNVTHGERESNRRTEASFPSAATRGGDHAVVLLNNMIDGVSLRERIALVTSFLKTEVMTEDRANTLMEQATSNAMQTKEGGLQKAGSILVFASGSDQYPQCAICLERLHVDETIGVSHNEACSHIFHKTCISEWLLKTLDCPVCRRKFLDLTATTSIEF